MKFDLNYDSSQYFFDLIALSVILLPAYLCFAVSSLRRVVFIFSGIYLLYFIAPRLALLSIIFWMALFVLQRLVAAMEARVAAQPDNKSIAALANLLFTASIVIALSPMLTWKMYEWDFVRLINLSSNSLLEFLNRPLWEIDLARDIVTPVGLSFATFRGIDLLVKTYIGKLKGLSLDRVLYYGFFPPILVVGPIIEYEEVQENAEGKLPTPAPDDILAGALRAAWGFFKILCLANFLQPASQILQSFAQQDITTIWIYLFTYTWFFYINFSGYSDIAIGMARIFGFRLKENFNNPFFARNIIEFWSGWHMSLYRFARRNVFVPLGGYRENRHILALAGTMMTIALWHALSASMVAFGLYHTVGLIAHRRFTRWKDKNNIKFESPLTQGAYVLATYLFVMLSFPLIVLPLDTAIGFYAAMFGLGG